MQKTEKIKRRIRRAEDLMDIVTTMKGLAAASIRRFEEASESVSDYHRTVEAALQAAFRNHPVPPDPGRRREAPLRRVLVVFGPGQRLCGSFGESLAQYVRLELDREDRGLPEKVAVTGDLMERTLASFDIPVSRRFPVPSSVSAISEAVEELLIAIEGWHAEGVDEIRIACNRPNPPSSYKPGLQLLLPVDRGWLRELAGRPWPSRSRPMHRLPSREIVRECLRQNLYVSLYRAYADSLAGEHAARLYAMQGAEDRIGEMLERLEYEYRLQRQGEITGELLDIMSGYEAQRDERS